MEKEGIKVTTMTMQIKQVHYFLIALLVVYVFFLSHSVVTGKALQKTDKQLIVETIKKTTPKDVVVTQIDGPYISGNYAMTGVIYGEGGGESLLKKEKGKWKIVSGGGGSFGEEGMIEYGGFPPKEAKEIMDMAEASWQKKGLK